MTRMEAVEFLIFGGLMAQANTCPIFCINREDLIGIPIDFLVILIAKKYY